ncbi:MAG: alpha/beta hydrolase [Actinomycetes bacterium]
MRIGTYLILGAALLGGCSEADGTSGAPSTAKASGRPATTATYAYPSPDCLPAGSDLFRVAKTADDRPIGVVVIGSGPRGVVLAPESDSGVCQWLPQARRLADRGFRVATFDWTFPPFEDNLAVAARTLRADGADHIAIVGASRGGMVGLSHAAAMSPRVAGVFALGAPNTTRGFGPVADGLKHYRGPVVMITSAGDMNASPRELRIMADAHPGKERVIVLSGLAHGHDLLTGPHGGAVTAKLDAFLGRVLPA